MFIIEIVAHMKTHTSVQGPMHAQVPRTSVHKRVTYTILHHLDYKPYPLKQVTPVLL